MTHGAILLAADGGLETAAPCWLPTAREEAMAAIATVAAAIKNNEQKMRRHGDGVNVGVGFEFVIIELPMSWVCRRPGRTPEPPLVPTKIRSERIDGAILRAAAWQRHCQLSAPHAKPAHPCSVTGACERHCNNFDTI